MSGLSDLASSVTSAADIQVLFSSVSSLNDIGNAYSVTVYKYITNQVICLLIQDSRHNFYQTRFS